MLFFLCSKAEVRTPRFTELAKEMATHLVRSTSENTNKKYFAAFNRWDSFIRAEGGSSLPAESIHVALYITHLIDNSSSSSVIEGAVYAIKWAHKIRGLNDPTDNCFVKSLLESAKRQCQRKINKKEPVTSCQLIELCKKYKDSEDVVTLRDLTLVILSFSGFLRFSEARELTCRNMTVNDDHVSLNITESKTGQYRNGSTIVISAGGTNACPVRMVKKYIRFANISSDSDHFVFKPVYRSKVISSLIAKNKPLSYTTGKERVVSMLKEVCGNANLGLHSLGAGAPQWPQTPQIMTGCGRFTGGGKQIEQKTGTS